MHKIIMIVFLLACSFSLFATSTETAGDNITTTTSVDLVYLNGVGWIWVVSSEDESNNNGGLPVI